MENVWWSKTCEDGLEFPSQARVLVFCDLYHRFVYWRIQNARAVDGRNWEPYYFLVREHVLYLTECGKSIKIEVTTSTLETENADSEGDGQDQKETPILTNIVLETS